MSLEDLSSEIDKNFCVFFSVPFPILLQNLSTQASTLSNLSMQEKLLINFISSCLTCSVSSHTNTLEPVPILSSGTDSLLVTILACGHNDGSSYRNDGPLNHNLLPTNSEGSTPLLAMSALLFSELT
uniref:Uncharacterized protein n=1 Tax=Cacopsylla melanoneura TaxID=428564 RepID=A0A8D8UAF0_9HEMI